MKKHNGVLLLYRLVCAGVLSMFSIVSSADAAVLAQLLQARSAVTETSARFEQAVTSDLLTEPLLSSGSLHYTAPDVLFLDISAPVSLHIEARATDVRIARGGKLHLIRPADYPDVAGYLQGIRAFLSGDEALLKKHYQVNVTGELPLWSLSLRPLQNSAISTVAFVGSGVDISRISIEKVSGDTVVLRIIETRSSTH